MTTRPHVLLLTLIAAFLLVTPAARAQTVLSAAQQKVIADKTAKLDAEERKILAGWSDAVKLAELICQPVVLAELKKVDKTADRVALGPDEAGRKQMKLEGNTKVSGRGTVRILGGWKDFSFVCTLDPEKGTATAVATIDKD